MLPKIFHRQMWLLAPVLLLVLTAGPSFADMVRVTGRAAVTDNDTDRAQRFALEDALYLAALEGGADVSGFSMADNGVLTGESILMRPNSRILDYSVVSQGRSGHHYEVVIDAYVGTAPALGCAVRPAVHLIAGTPQINVGPTAPLWAKEALELAHDATITGLSATPQIQISARDISLVTVEPSGSRLPAGFDYNSLMGGQPRVEASRSNQIPDTARGLHLSWHATAPGLQAATLTVTLQAQVLDPAAPGRAQQMSTSHVVAVSANTPFRTINVLARKDAHEVAKSVAANVSAELATWLGSYACAPLQGYLTVAGTGRFRIDLGSRDGLTHQSLAFAEGRGQPWTVFRIVELSPSQAIVSPMNARRAGAHLAGAQVRFDIGG
jgi:hypothetical protein